MDTENTFKKKKKGKSFLQKAKKFGKQGQRGRGTEIDQDQYDYLVRVLERWREGFENDEEKKIFVGNVMDTTDGNERLLAGNQLGSRVIEMLLPEAEAEVVEKFCSALSQDLRLVCLDSFMSHVLEKLLILRSFVKSDSQVSADKSSSEWLLKVCKFVINNTEDFCNDVYASHLVRTCTECLTGQRYKMEANNQARTVGYDDRTVWTFANNEDTVNDCDEVLEIFTNRLVGLSAENIASELCVRVINVFCHLGSAKTKHQPLVRKFILHLLETVLSAGVDVEDTNIVRLSETVVSIGLSDGGISDKIYNLLIEGKEEELSCHPSGNFVIQRLLDNVTDKELFTKIVETLAEGMETILSNGCTGVILALVKAGVRLATGQTMILNKLTDALHCQDDQESLSPCVVYMRTKESLTQDSLSVHLHGSLILQQLLLFNKPIKLVRSLLALPSHQLSQLLSDPRGCHITDSFMTSGTLGEKSRESLVKGLKGEFVSLACSKHGSRSLDTLWKHSSIKCKQIMVDDLTYKLDILNSNKFGSFIVKNWFVAEFKRNKSDWQKLVEKEDKIADAFTDIIGDKVVNKRKSDKTIVTEQPAKKKKEVTDIVDDWLKPENEVKKEKKKKKAKSYLDDL